MVKLRHISGDNLKELEKTLEQVKSSIVIVGVNAVGSNWYIHFLVQDADREEKQKTKLESGFATKELAQIKKGK